MKVFKSILSVILVLCLAFSMVPAYAADASRETANVRGVNNGIIIDDDATGGYEGDYVVIYNPATSSSTSYSTGTMTGLIETTVNPSVGADPGGRRGADTDLPFYKIDVDPQLRELAETVDDVREPEPTRASYNVGDTKTFKILAQYSPTGSSSVSFECLYVGSHCYIWTPVSSSNNTYPLDEIDSSYAKMAADEFDSKFDLMQSSFGTHTNGSSGDGKLHMLYYNINDGWQPGQGYIAGFFYQVDISNNGLPILNIDTYPGVYYKNSAGTEYKRMDDTYNTMVHEYQHLINYSHTSGMSSWLNECFSAAAEEICYPGSSVVDRIQSWENYYYSDNNDWLNPPAEFAYNPTDCPNLHKGYSMYGWSNDIDDVLALYGQVSLFAQYLFTRFGNTIYQQISNKYSSSEPTAITNATGVSCANLVRDFRVAVTANATQDQYNGVYGFKTQEGYDPTQYHDVANPWSLLSPVVFTGTSCSIKGGGAITVKPVGGVYNPPSGASSSLKYIGIKLASPYTVTAVSNNTAWGTVAVNGTTITCTPADGYYVQGYEVTAGTATCTVNGDIITVTPTSDCTIKVIFAAKPTYTVNFVACGASAGSQSALVNDVITLPATAPDAEGWTFSGWTDAQLAETTEKPTYYAPGAAYTVTDNATLYALYTRTEGGGSETVYQLLTAAPSDWAGNYVITNNGTGSSTSPVYVLKGVTPSSNGATIEDSSNCSTLAASGITQNDNILTNVSNDYIFALAASGSYYTVQSASTGAYYGMNSSSYLSGYTAVNTTYCRWTPAINTSGAAQLKNAANGSYPYFGFSTSNNYFWSASTNNANVLKLWKETEISSDITYYTTDPVVIQPHEHDWGEPEWTWNGTAAATATFTCQTDNSHVETVNATVTSETTAASCETDGETVYTATVTFNDKTYTDTRTETISATGHVWGEPEWTWNGTAATAKFTCANDATHTQTVNATVTSETTAATCETDGETVYTAAVTFNDKTYTDTRTETIPATGHTWGEPEWTWNGTAATAKFTCTNDATHTQTVNATVTSETTAATCEVDGETVYTATVTFNDKTYTDTKTETIPATGHTWGEPTYEWSADNGSVTAQRVCVNDATHVETETAETAYEIVTEPTTESEGLGRYTAVFQNTAFESQTKDVVIPKLSVEGYHIRVTDYTAGNATTGIEAETLYSGDVTFTVSCAAPCVVAVDNGNDAYTVLTCTTSGDEHSFTVTVTNADVTIVIAVKGDANLNGAREAKDATFAAQAAAGKRTFTALQQLAMDGNGDGVFDSKDATYAAQVESGKRSYKW